MTDWFTIMNVKSKFSGVQFRDKNRSPWTLNCEAFTKLKDFSETISSCEWNGGSGRKLKLKKHTAKTFITTTESNVAAATYFLEKHEFQYVFLAIVADDILEKFFGQTRQRKGGNFYIDFGDVLVQILHTLVKYITPTENSMGQCASCTEPLNIEDLKHKVIFIGVHLVHKHGQPDLDVGECISSEFLDELNRGGLSMPTLSTTFFVHGSFKVMNSLPHSRCRCRKYFKRVIGKIDAPIANDNTACNTITNILFKAFVNNNSDRQSELGCLRRKENYLINMPGYGCICVKIFLKM